jgi:hypothetical protein
MPQKYVNSPNGWHAVHGTGVHPASGSHAYVTSCGVTILPGAVPTMVDPKTLPAKQCKFCSTLTPDQLQTMRDKILKPTMTSVNSNPTFSLPGSPGLAMGKVASARAPASLSARAKIAAARSAAHK